MPLNKPHGIGTGNSGDHWEISMLVLDIDGGAMEARINQYKDQASKNAGLKPMSVKTVKVQLPANINGILNSTYASIKNNPTSEGEETPFFSDATDV